MYLIYIHTSTRVLNILRARRFTRIHIATDRLEMGRNYITKVGNRIRSRGNRYSDA
jgi:hypothetical protein